MGNKSLIANWIAKCNRKIEVKCEGDDCPKCQYVDICMPVYMLNRKFEEKGYLK